MQWRSHSEIDTLSKCERLWYYKHKLRLEPKKEYSRPLAFGIYGHEWLAAYYTAIKAGASPEEATNIAHGPLTKRMEKMEVYAGLAMEITTLMGRYVRYYIEENQTRFRILAVEQAFRAPLDDNYGIAMRLDVLKYGISGEYRGRIILEDHKFTYDFWPDARVKMHSQIPKYIWTLNNDPSLQNQLDGRKIDLGFFNQLRYRKMADHNEFFKRIKTEPNEIRQHNVMEEFKKFASHATYLHSLSNEECSTFVSRAQNEICEYCPFATPCSMGLDGLDESETLELGFKLNDYGYND